jgi:CTP:molybdopterin cytidylyltransferase MocA
LKEKGKALLQAALRTTMARAVPAVILAAGASSRLGKPKALVEFEGKTLVGWAYEHLANAGCDPIVVVTRSELSVDILLAVPGVNVSINPHPELGRTGSLQNGISCLHTDIGTLPQRLVMAPVDRPGWNTNLVKQLLLHKRSVCPVHNGQRGHPVAVQDSDIKRILAAPSDTPLRDILSFDELPVDAPWLHLNIDTPDDLLKLNQQGPELRSYFTEGQGI